MENIELLGQQQGRRAVKLTKRGFYSEAAVCHRNCAEFFKKLQSEKDLPAFRRSWEEQQKYHSRQAEILETLSKLNSTERSIREKIEFCLSKHEPLPIRSQFAAMENILQKFEEQESLLLDLKNKSKSKATSHKGVETSTHKVNYTIQPKNDADIIEELRESNASLKELVKKLMEELEKVQIEKRALEKKLEFYETCSMPVHANLMDAMDRLPPQFQLPDLAPLEPPPSTF